MTYSGVGGGSVVSVDNFQLADSMAASGSHDFTVARGLGASDLTITSAIANGGSTAQSLVKLGGGILTLGGSNTYSGDTDVLAGTLALGASAALPAASNVDVSGGTLNLGGFSASAGTVTLQSGAIANGVLSAAFYNVQSGTVSTSLGGPAALTMSTAGTVTLSSPNSYQGGTFLNAGELSVGADSELGASGGALNFNGGMLQVTGTQFKNTSRPIVWGPAGGGFDIQDATNTLTLNGTQALSGSGTLAKSGEGLLQLDAPVQCAAIAIDGGTLRLGASNELTNSPVVSISYSSQLDAAGYNQTLGGLTMSDGTLDSGAGVITLAGSVTYLQSIWTATINGNLSLGALTCTFNVASGSAMDLLLNASVSGSGSAGITKSGSGLLTFAGTNTYAGNTTVNGGLVQFMSPLAISGSGRSVIPAANTAVVAGYAIDNAFLERLQTGTSAAFTVGMAVDSGNNLDFNSTAGASLAAASLGAWGSVTYTGTLTPSGSTYRLGGLGGALTLSNNNALTGNNGLLVGSTGNGTVILAGTNNYTGDTTIQAGVNYSGGPLIEGVTLQLGVANALPSGPGKGNVTANGLLDLAGYSAAIDGLSGSGIVDNSGNHAVTLTVGANNATGAFSGSIMNTGTESVTAARLHLVKTGSGMETLSGSDTYGGGTTVSGGTLEFANPTALPTASILTINGGEVVLGDLTGDDSLSTADLPAADVAASPDHLSGAALWLAIAAARAAGGEPAALPAGGSAAAQPVAEPASWCCWRPRRWPSGPGMPAAAGAGRYNRPGRAETAAHARAPPPGGFDNPRKNQVQSSNDAGARNRRRQALFPAKIFPRGTFRAEEGATMPQAIVDPEELRRFAQNLKKFNHDVQERVTALGSQLDNLGRTWRDQENKKFAEEFQQHMQVVRLRRGDRPARAVPAAQGRNHRRIPPTTVGPRHGPRRQSHFDRCRRADGRRVAGLSQRERRAPWTTCNKRSSALQWIHHDCKEYWAEAVRRGWQGVSEARLALQHATTYRRVADHQPSCVDEKRALAAAKRRLEVAQEKVAAVRHWSRVIDRAIDEYRAARTPVATFLEADYPRRWRRWNGWARPCKRTSPWGSRPIWRRRLRRRRPVRSLPRRPPTGSRNHEGLRPERRSGETGTGRQGAAPVQPRRCRVLERRDLPRVSRNLRDGCGTQAQEPVGRRRPTRRSPCRRRASVQRSRPWLSQCRQTNRGSF